MKVRFVLYHSIVPVLLGALIYLIFRTKSLLVFTWIDHLGLSCAVDDLRLIARFSPPDWIKFSLPDGLWVYACASLMGSIWYKSEKSMMLAWVSVGPILGVCGEMGQKLRFIPGTFCFVDLLVVSVFSLIAIKISLLRYRGCCFYE